MPRRSSSPPLPDERESAWQATIVEVATLGGWRHFHPYNMRRSDPGWPDLVLVRPPEAIFVEVKTRTGKLRAEQVSWLADLRACGLEVYVWRPEDFAEVQQRLLRRTRATA